MPGLIILTCHRTMDYLLRASLTLKEQDILYKELKNIFFLLNLQEVTYLDIKLAAPAAVRGGKNSKLNQNSLLAMRLLIFSIKFSSDASASSELDRLNDTHLFNLLGVSSSVLNSVV